MTLRPAFRSRAHAAAYALFATACLVLPVLLATFGRPTRSDCYHSIRPTSGPFAYVEREALDSAEDIDIAFVGPSHLWTAIDTPLVQRQLSVSLGRPSTVRTLGFNWSVLDVTYAVLVDLFAHHRVKTVVFEMPRVDNYRNGPHPMAYRLLDFKDHGDVLADLGWQNRIELYGDFVLGAPRQLLSFLRPEARDASTEFVERLGAGARSVNLDGSPFESISLPPAPVDPASTLYSPSSAAHFSFSHDPLTPYEEVFAKKILALITRNGARAITVHTPMWEERRSTLVLEREPWPNRFDLALVGVPAAELFGGLSDEQVGRLFADENHLNVNGARFFTQAILPGLVKAHGST